MESGIPNATNARRYVQRRLNKPKIDSKLNGVLKECKLSYDSVIASFRSALSDVRDDKEYQTATYDLLLASTNYIKPCIDVVASKKIKDGTILIGNRIVPIFKLSAYEVVDRLDSSKQL
ncbi:hypothetical protein BUALT_Bualt12G0106300 [Buddleja alternifolia]|uniref:Uncharacterized protein n=1 Tax=Buddleja alternifolia TaxID=168488 RepID=A0AAV6WV05_9LAMI|nr:hypothetical protein BUALT_Bualt12G0106300 [Buddleja alternifolia]